MKKFYYLSSLIAIITFVTVACESTSLEETTLESIQNKKGKGKAEKCATIQSGDILYPDTHYLVGESLSAGFDVFGFNYQAHIYKGLYANLYLSGYGYPQYEGDDSYFINFPELINPGSWFFENYYPYRNDEVTMTWNDAWQPNKDCDNDGFLDIVDYSEVIGSGGWENYHSKGTYTNKDGKLCQWEQHTKIVAIPENAILNEGYWFDENGNEIGEKFWGSYAIIQIVFNDPYGEATEIEEYLSPFRAGFGNR